VNTWTQLGDDIDGEASSDYSGTSVSLSADGSILAVGGPYNDGNGRNSGHVPIYAIPGGEGAPGSASVSDYSGSVSGYSGSSSVHDSANVSGGEGAPGSASVSDYSGSVSGYSGSASASDNTNVPDSQSDDEIENLRKENHDLHAHIDELHEKFTVLQHKLLEIVENDLWIERRRMVANKVKQRLVRRQ